jgi:hypothetical protein
MVMLTAQTRCAICGEHRGLKKMSALAAFVRNAKDPLFSLSGRAFHADCFDKHPLRDRAIAMAADRRARMAVPVKDCVVCGASIQSDGCTTDLMATEPEHPLYRFNYVYLHRPHLIKWAEFAEFERAVEAARHEERWEGVPIIRLGLRPKRLGGSKTGN